MSHEEIQQQIPAYVASRLEPEAARRLEEHFAGCDFCRELAATAAEIAGVIREGGDALFEPHPRELALGEYAGGTSTSEEQARIERHLSYCATCRLEMEAWRSELRSSKPSSRLQEEMRERARGRRSGWLAPTLAAAAGLVLGAVLILLIQGFPGPLEPARPPETPAAAPSKSWEGDSPLYVLPGMVRGGEGLPVFAWTLGKGDSHLSLGVQPVLPSEIADGALYRLELLRDDGSKAWSVEMTVGKMREHLRTPAEVVHLTLSTTGLTPGSYEFRISPASPPVAPPIYRARVEIAASR